MRKGPSTTPPEKKTSSAGQGKMDGQLQHISLQRPSDQTAFWKGLWYCDGNSRSSRIEQMMVYERYMMMVYSNQGYMMVNRYGFQKLTICFYFTQTLDLPKKRFGVPTPAPKETERSWG